MSGTATDGRAQRRKTVTRQALIGAAQTLVAKGRTAVSIQEITDLADVGFGSFYNHFTSKDDLFAAAVDLALTDHAALVQEAYADVTDPAERFAIGVRVTGRLSRLVPELVRVVLNSGVAVVGREQGLAAQARGDIEAGIAAGRFVSDDVDLSLMTVAGALLGALQHLEQEPGADAALCADRLAVSLLLMLGVDRKEAARLAALPLPTFS